MKITKQTIIYLGTTIMVCGLLYLLLKGRIIEGLSNAGMTEIIAKGLSNDIKKLEDTLLINKYSDNYRAIVNDMSKWADLAILNGLISSKLNVQDGVSESNTQIITSLNQYAQLKESLQGVKNNLLSK